MHRSPEEKREIIHIVEHSALSVTQTLKELDVPRSSFFIAGMVPISKKVKKA